MGSFRGQRVPSADHRADDRSQCSTCFGKGCPACGHHGTVCPVCRGMRFVRAQEWSQERPHVAVLRCDACCEGNQVNDALEARTIVAYLERRRLLATSPAQPSDMG